LWLRWSGFLQRPCPLYLREAGFELPYLRYLNIIAPDAKTNANATTLFVMCSFGIHLLVQTEDSVKISQQRDIAAGQ